MCQAREQVKSPARRCDEIVSLIDAVLVGASMDETASGLGDTRHSGPGDPAMAAAPVG